MYTGVLHLHSFWAYLVLGVLLITVINSIAGLAGKKEFVAKDFRLALFSLIVTHIQLLVGLILWFVSPLGLKAISTAGMGEVMGNSAIRLNVVEHPLMMIIAVILITIGYSKHKKKLESSAKFKTIVIFYILTLVVILSRLPWDQWF
ncbi:MAG TPA: hypothetical protein VKX30_03900 [Flavobacteriaceae bacterium]|nr:hypothetical protein [Flavobacteriaceae bacterium]